VGDWLRRAFARDPLLPASLGHGRVTNDSVSLAVRDHAGVERFRSQPREWPALGVEVPYGEAYSGVLRGSTVRVSLDPAAAGDLVIGGLPRSRLPALFGLLVLTAGLLFTAARQLRRERALGRLRAEFVASVSHELRTPLTQIRMFAETLRLDRVRSPEERQRCLEILDKEARRLTNLVENMLQFSRSERGTVLLAMEEHELAPLVAEVVTARGEEADKVRGLKMGADDYITKPFGLLELLARIEALLRRGQGGGAFPGGAARLERFGDVEVEARTRSVFRRGESVDLAPKEFDLLLALLRARGGVVSRLDLMTQVWGYSAAVVSRTVDTHVAELRRKLEDRPSEPRHLLTVRKIGYRLRR
jgi:DNA-binding response OmpR family regulator